MELNIEWLQLKNFKYKIPYKDIFYVLLWPLMWSSSLIFYFILRYNFFIKYNFVSYIYSALNCDISWLICLYRDTFPLIFIFFIYIFFHIHFCDFISYFITQKYKYIIMLIIIEQFYLWTNSKVAATFNL